MKRLVIGLLGLGLMLALGGLGLGFAGRYLPSGDSFAVIRVPLAALAVLLCLTLAVLARRRGMLVAAAVAVAAAAPAALGYVRAPAGPEGSVLTLYQKNLNFRWADIDAIAADIVASGADVVTLQEVSERNLPLLEALRAAYPHQAYCRFGRVGGTAVLSRLEPEGERICTQAGGLTALRVGMGGRPVWVVSVHLHWPWPYGQWDHVAALLPVIGGLDGPVIVGGDFNMVPWGASVARIGEAAGSARTGLTEATFSIREFPANLPIDHVLLPEGWSGQTELRPLLGSDHRGVLARFSAH